MARLSEAIRFDEELPEEWRAEAMLECGGPGFRTVG
jgi:hypothetical protein